ncbi:uncharacterized protein LOC133193960 [Saccostrea echinata]|uniref:uncharacterized protein LOC133193960 n=1 Tax=Saccostrea echinata TaxID=191078 RepID=UPI002A80AC27|nr:uncharacterized protein LOC133193960 [Saccostrea echinata]
MMAVGLEPPVTYFSSLISSIFIYLLVLLFCYIFYQMSRLFLPWCIQEYVLDYFKTLAFCTYCFGHGVLRDAHGHLGYVLCVVPLNTVSILIFHVGDGTPLEVWLRYLKRKIPAWKFLLKVTAQILAGFSSWELGHLFYRLDFHRSFDERVSQQENCESDLNTSPLSGFLLETVVVTYDFWLDQQTLSKYVPIDLALKILNCAVLVCLGLSKTGMYLHPAMATGHTFGCGSTSVWSHILVYWIGPFLGILIGLKLAKRFRLPFYKKPTLQKTESVVQNGDQSNSLTEKLIVNGFSENNEELRHRNTQKASKTNGKSGMKSEKKKCKKAKTTCQCCHCVVSKEKHLMTWRDVWVVALGFEPPVTHFSAAVSAIIIYLLALLFCYVSYQLARALMPRIVQEYVLDFFKTLAFCTYCFGHGVIRNAHGHLGYVLCVVPLNTASVLIFNIGDGTPLTVWSKYLRGQIPKWKFFAKVSAQILAGFFAWELGHYILSLDFHSSFSEKITQKSNCNSDLRIAAIAGFALEGIGVAYDFWMNQQTLSKYKPLDIALKFTNTALIVCIGVKMTGMYIHPALATGRTLGCGTTPILSHLLVYWGGPFVGIYLGLKASQFISLPFIETPKIEESAKDVQNDAKFSEPRDKKVHAGKVRQRNKQTHKKS